MNDLQIPMYQVIVEYFINNAWDSPRNHEEWFKKHADDIAEFMSKNFDDELLLQSYNAAEHLRGE